MSEPEFRTGRRRLNNVYRNGHTGDMDDDVPVLVAFTDEVGLMAVQALNAWYERNQLDTD